MHIWTVGHSNHAMEHFLDLLRDREIEVVADVRSSPYSRHASQFNQSAVRSRLVRAGFNYMFFGDELGGRPSEPELYDDEYYVLYGVLAEMPRFRAGLDRLREVASQKRVAMMCSEEDPKECHRRLLVARALLNDDPACLVTHIRDKNDDEDDDLSKILSSNPQPTLFGEPPWRSARSVLQNTQQRVSSPP